MSGMERLLREHPLFRGLDPAFVDVVCGCARNTRFESGEYLRREGDEADALYLIRQGLVALEINAPGRGAIRFQTLADGELVGVSWLVPPYRWMYDARVVERTRAIALDARCLRGKCDADPALGYEVLKRLLPTLVSRLHATRMQVLDVYGTPE
ncbi:cyclic nucleotide-binding domain-containing protein [Arhodomonas sp. AD133]|uniref:cyclic nucleotide-binding domain-containing protein n=1 Tax=Arhodomonas sp. AD133 TaxID=3415009 RepID=UPI003EB82234